MTRKTILWIVCSAVSVVVCAALIVGAIFLFRKDDKGLTTKDLGKVLGLTGQAIETCNGKIVDNFNEYWQTQQVEMESRNVEGNSTDTDLSDLLGNMLYEINYAESFYTISEYFNEFLSEDFLDKTFLVKQIVFDQTIYARFTLNRDNMHIEIYDVNKMKNETEHVYIYFSDDKPTRLVFNSAEEGESIYGYGSYYRNAMIDFENQTFVVTLLSFKPGTTFDEVGTFDKEFFRNNLNYCEHYEIYFDNLFNPDAKNFDIDYSYEGTEQELELVLEYAKDMDIFAGTDAKTGMGIDNAIIFNDGTKCINYAFNKYVITADEQSGYLKTRQSHGLPDEILEGVNLFKSVAEGTYEIPSEFDGLTFEHEGTNYKHNILENVEVNDLIMALNEWYEQSYDSEKYYYEVENFEGVNIVVNVGLFAGVKKTDDEIQCFLISTSYTQTTIEFFDITSSGVHGFNLLIGNYKFRVSERNLYVSHIGSSIFKSSVSLINFMNNYYDKGGLLDQITDEEHVEYRVETYDDNQDATQTYYYCKRDTDNHYVFSSSSRSGVSFSDSWQPSSVSIYELTDVLKLLNI